MLHFFRRLRLQHLFSENVRKYIFYALGEILLVVIGILIALQINTSNQHRLDRIEEKKILANLHSEFLQNAELLRESINSAISARNAGIEVMQLMGENEEFLKTQNTDSLLFYSLPSENFLPSGNSVNNVIQSGRLSLISNDELIKKLYQWDAIVESVKDYDNGTDQWVNEQVLTFLADHISFKEMDATAGYECTGTSRLPHNSLVVFQSLRFENLLDNTLYLYLHLITELEKAELLINEILILTETD